MASRARGKVWVTITKTKWGMQVTSLRRAGKSISIYPVALPLLS